MKFNLFLREKLTTTQLTNANNNVLVECLYRPLESSGLMSSLDWDHAVWSMNSAVDELFWKEILKLGTSFLIIRLQNSSLCIVVRLVELAHHANVTFEMLFIVIKTR